MKRRDAVGRAPVGIPNPIYGLSVGVWLFASRTVVQRHPLGVHLHAEKLGAQLYIGPVVESLFTRNSDEGTVLGLHIGKRRSTVTPRDASVLPRDLPIIGEVDVTTLPPDQNIIVDGTK